MTRLAASDVLLVTGGAGFIGGQFVREVVGDSSARVINLDLLTYSGNLESLSAIADNERYQFVAGDIGDSDLVSELLREHRPNAVINFAAESHVDRSIDGPDEFIRTNVVGTAQLLKTCLAYWEALPPSERTAFRFLHVSTDEVYGSLGASGLFTEQSPYRPNSPYSASKAASDHLVRAYHSTYGLPTVISNCSNNYGPFQFPEKLIPLVTLNAIEGRPLPVYGDGTNVRDWLHVADHCRALRDILQRGTPGDVYNIGGHSEKTNLEVVHAICAAVDAALPPLPEGSREKLIKFVEDRPGHDHRYAVDTTKIATQLSWQPRVRFEDGIQQTVRWYIENRDWVERVASGQYQQERLGLRQSGSQGQSAPAKSSGTPSVPANAYSPGDAIEGVVVRELRPFSDDRGWLIELFRADELAREDQPVMAYVSETLPGVARGPHEHVEQSDYFAFVGPGDFRLYCWDSRPRSSTYGVCWQLVCGASNPCSVIVPPGVVHAYVNVSEQPGWVFNAPNRLYAGHGKTSPVDEIRHEDDGNSPYLID